MAPTLEPMCTSNSCSKQLFLSPHLSRLVVAVDPAVRNGFVVAQVDQVIHPHPRHVFRPAKDTKR